MTETALQQAIEDARRERQGSGQGDALTQAIEEARQGEPGLVDRIMDTGRDMGRGLAIGTQGVGRGAADLLGAPVDLATAAINAGAGGLNLASGATTGDYDRVPYMTSPVGGSDWISEQATAMGRELGIEPFDYEDLSTGERVGYMANRFGSQAASAGSGLARAAQTPARAAQTRASPTVVGRMGDALTRPYMGGTPGRTVAADTAGGVGAGAAMVGVEDRFENPAVQTAADVGAALAGGLGGQLAGSAAVHGAPGAVRGTLGLGQDPTAPFTAPGSMVAPSRRVMDATAGYVQGQASDPASARQALRRQETAAQETGDPMPTTGIASDDIGMIELERRMRGQGSPVDPTLRRRFAESDEALRTSASERIGSMRPADGDPQVALEAARNRPFELRQQREDAALPILRRAEESGATVNAQPVAEQIDQMLSTSKRPAVRTALTDARRMLNRPGTDELDTSVSGLYETRKAINDLIEGRTETPTGRYAQSELIELRNTLDRQINEAAPEFGEYMSTFREGSRPLDVYRDSAAVKRMVESESDMRNVARRLFSTQEYGSDQVMRNINEAIGDNPEAMRGWKAAVADVMRDRVTQAGTGEISTAQLNRVYRNNREALAQTFSPEDMQTLDRVHDIMNTLQNVGRGSGPAQAQIPSRDIRGQIEGALLLSGTDAITTGMIMTRISRAADMVGLERLTTPHKVARVVEQMQFDPDLARHILERPIPEGTSPLWSGQLRNLMASTELGRQLGREGEEDEELSIEDTIMQGGP